jgi:hypothetical protein
MLVPHARSHGTCCTPAHIPSPCILLTRTCRCLAHRIIRLRTDLVFFEPLPTPHTLSTSHAHVPSGGCTYAPLARWTNDHLFVCPRGLCHPYFELLELWTSPQCDPTEAAPLGIFASVDNQTGRLRPNGLVAATPTHASRSRPRRSRPCRSRPRPLKDARSSACGGSAPDAQLLHPHDERPQARAHAVRHERGLTRLDST